MKTHTSPQSIHVAPDAIGADGAVTNCTNLIPTAEGARRALRAAPTLHSVSTLELHPLAQWNHADEDFTITTLYSYCTSVDMSLWVEVGMEEPYEVEHPSVKEIYCAVATAEGFTVMTSAGPLSLRYTSEGWICPGAEADRLTVPELITERAGQLTAPIAARTFTKVTTSHTAIEVPESQLRTLASELCGAYEQIAAAAASGALWLQPVVARIVLRDADGNALLESAPTMSRHTMQCTEALTASCTKPAADTISASAMTLTGDAYRLKLRLSAKCVEALDMANVRAVEVWVSPQCHPMDASAEMPVRWTAVSSQQPALTVALPGATSHFASRQGEYLRRMRTLMSNPAATMSRRLTLRAPFTEGTYQVDAAPLVSVEADNRSAAKADASAGKVASTTTAQSLLRSILAPSAFIARCGCVCGDKVLWGNITPLPPVTVDLANICTFDTTLNGSWSAHIRVGLRQGGELAYTVSGTGSGPAGWAPAVAWPMADARTLDVYVVRGNSTLHGHIELEEAADGSSAYHIDPLFQTQMWTSHQGLVPEPQPAPAIASHAGAVAIAPISAPATPTAAGICCPAAITAVAPARRTFSAWDSASVRAYAFSGAGIFAITCSGVTVSSALIDRRPVTRGATVAVTPSGILAASDRALLLISGTSITSRRMPFEVSAVAWHHQDAVAWLLDTRGNVALCDWDGEWSSMLSLPVAIKEIANTGAQVVLTSSEGVWRPGRQSAARPVAWRRIVPLPCGRRLHGACIHMSASSFEGSVSLSSLYDEADEPITTTLALSGRISEMLPVRLAMPRRPMLVIELSGNASADFTLYGINLTLV